MFIRNEREIVISSLMVLIGVYRLLEVVCGGGLVFELLFEVGLVFIVIEFNFRL